MSDTLTYIPSAERLLALGFGMPQKTPGAYSSISYHNIELTKAIVVWPASREVRLSIKPAGHSHWSPLYTGCPQNAEEFEKELSVNCFIFPEQAQAQAQGMGYVAADLCGLLSEEVATNLLNAKDIRDKHAILKNHANYGSVVLSQVGIGLLAHAKAQAALYEVYHALVAEQLKGLLRAPADLDDLFATRRRDTERMNKRIEQAAIILGIKLLVPTPGA